MTERRCPLCGAIPDDLRTHVCAAESATVPDGLAAERATAGREGDLLAGRYRLVRKVGEGGMGEVYLAHDRQLGLDVAVKLLVAGSPSPAIVERLKREIRITRDIDHPNVSRVFDLGEADGRQFLTMRWIEGEPLRARVQRHGPFRGEALLRLANGLVAALAAAHRIGVVHRDVTPANVMVSPEGEPTLVDFGVATDAGVSPGAKARRGDRITLDGHQPGTPAFMAPEQLRGEATGPAADVYALALTIAFAATGRTGRPESPWATFASLGRPLAAALARCLEEEAARRPKDAIAIEESVRRAGRRRVGVGIVAVAVAAVAAALVLGLRFGDGGGRGPPAVRVSPLVNRSGDPDLAWLEHGGADLVAAGIEGSGRARLAIDDRAKVRAARIGGTIHRGGGRVELRLVLEGPDGRTLARARVADATGDSLLGGVDRAVSSFLSVLGAAPARGQTARRSRDVVANVAAFEAYARAQDLVRSRRHAEALGALREATKLDPSFALAHLATAVLVSSARSASDAEATESLEAVRANRDRLPPGARALADVVDQVIARPASPERIDRLRAYLASHPPDAALYRMATQLPRVDAGTRRALLEEWSRRIPADPEPHNGLGYLFVAGDPVAAEREFREYLKLAPREANAHDSYGDFLRFRGRTAEAVAAYDRALEVDPSFAPAAVHACVAAIQGGDLSLAETRLARAKPLVRAETREADAWASAWVAVPLLAGKTAAALERLERLATDPSLGARAYLARFDEAIVRGLAGDARGARAAADECSRLAVLYHGGSSRLTQTLAPWVEGLAARRHDDARALARAATEMADVVRRIQGLDPPARWRVQADVLAALGLVLSGDPGAGASALRTAAAIPDAGGASFLAGRERAKALVLAGRLGEAEGAYADLLARAGETATAVEAAFEWRSILGEAGALARTRGDAARADAIEARLAALAWPGDRAVQ